MYSTNRIKGILKKINIIDSVTTKTSPILLVIFKNYEINSTPSKALIMNNKLPSKKNLKIVSFGFSKKIVF